ncbi:MAG: glycosyltransferase family 2 protein [Chitinophagales bacterium]
MNYTSNPTVSVVMATYNRGVMVCQTIKNILEQDYRPLELIVVNDGSKDDTQHLLEELQKAYSFVLVQNHQNLGLQKSLNKGLQQATGKYIARIDDHDTWLTKDKLTKQVAFLEIHPEVGIVGTGYQIGEKTMLNPLTDTAIRQQMLFRCPFCHVTMVMRSDIVKKLGGYNENLPYSEDWELWLRIGQQTQLANLSDITVAVTEEEASLSSDFFLKQLPLNSRIVQKHLKNYPNGFKARIYHSFLQSFFTLFPLNGRVHRGMQRVFSLLFLRG